MEQTRKKKKSSEPYYDLIDDFDLIVSSFASEYGIRVLSAQFNDISWNEFVSLLAGLGPKTPLSNVIQIRSENDQDILKTFTKEQIRIRNEYRNKIASKVSEQDMEVVLEQFKQAFMDLAGE